MTEDELREFVKEQDRLRGSWQYFAGKASGKKESEPKMKLEDFL